MQDFNISCVSRAYEQLNVKHESLQLIQPQFETPLPTLQPAVSANLQAFKQNIKAAMTLLMANEIK